MTDYNQIAKAHKVRYGTDRIIPRILRQLYGDDTHFVYELVQNAEDSQSQRIGFRLAEDALLVWNDGCRFHEQDVRSICSIGLSDKDLTQIGNFGIGFKAVYSYTDLPEIYSGDERFRICNSTKPERVDDVHPAIQALVADGKTVFRLPFKKYLRPEEIDLLRNRLRNLEKRALLFLRHLEMVQWQDENNGQTGAYIRHCQPHDTVQNAFQVELQVSTTGEEQSSETFLVFRKAVQPPQVVIDELLLQVEDDEERQRLQRKAGTQQPIEVAFRLQDGRIKPLNGCVLFAYLPTEKETHLRFIIQARYQTKLARDNIPVHNPWNKWLVAETANFLPDILEQLKAGDLLDAAFFNVLPLTEDNVPAEFAPIAAALQQAMKERPLVPTKGNGYAKAENVFYPHAESLRNLVECSWIHPNSSWLHPDIRDVEEFRRCFKMMREAGVREISVSQVLRWLEEQSLDWFASKPVEWLRALYAYLNPQSAEEIKKLPLVRLENGQHVCARDQLVFFPPDTDEAREEIAPFLSELPILQSALLEIDGDEHDDMKAFLGKLGVQSLSTEKMIRKWICPKYHGEDKPSAVQNRMHVRYLFKVWDKISESEREKIQNLPMLWAYRGEQREAANFVAPCDAYLPEAYTGDADLETYFSACDDAVWFVDSGYLENNNDAKAWLRFLKAIGAMDALRLIPENLHVTHANLQELDLRNIKRPSSIRKGTIKDFTCHGLQAVLHEISNQNQGSISRVLWRLLVKTFQGLPSEKRSAFFRCTFRWFYRRGKREWSQTFDTTFYRQLKEKAWMPDEQGKLRPPSECFAPTDEIRRLLGDSVAYLHPDLDLSEEAARWLAEKLTGHLSLDTETVLAHLETLSENRTASVEDIEPLYHFLSQQDSYLGHRFRGKSLIFAPAPEPHWWRTDEVFWEDESAVFGNDRGYLETYYPQTLKRFFTDKLEISERAFPVDYVRGIREVASGGRAADAEVRARVEILYRRLWPFLQEGEDWQNDAEWQQTRDGKCWIGKKGDAWGFFRTNELVWNNHSYLAELFNGEVPFWAFPDDLLELAKHLRVAPCSQTRVQFLPSGDQEEYQDWSEKVQKLRADIQVFFESPQLCGEDKSADVLNRVSVCLVEELTVTYTLKGNSITDQENPRQSFLDTKGQDTTLWLGLGADKDEYPELIGDALQAHFDVPELRGFVEDLLTKNRGKVLARWKQRGLRAELCASSSEPDHDADEAPTKTLEDTESGYAEPEADTPAPEISQVSEDAETDTGFTDSASETSTDFPPRDPGRTSLPGGQRRSVIGGRSSNNRRRTPNHRRSNYPPSSSGGGEGEEHQRLKKCLADNPSQLGEGLELVRTEYAFPSGDRVDILFEDISGNPVTVEVETDYPHSGIWQAVKYQHLAAVEYEIPCEQVRSILAAPKIPDDVKQECERLGIEPVEVGYP